MSVCRRERRRKSNFTKTNILKKRTKDWMNSSQKLAQKQLTDECNELKEDKKETLIDKATEIMSRGSFLTTNLYDQMKRVDGSSTKREL